jgi:2-haloacid dehalogenase
MRIGCFGAISGRYRGFWALARESLGVVAARHGIADEALLNDILQAYRRLEAYPEVAGALRALKARGLRTAILSNGEANILAEAVEAAGLTDLLDAVLGVDEIEVYKPEPRVYSLATEHFGVQPAEAAFFSSNPLGCIWGAGVWVPGVLGKSRRARRVRTARQRA